MGLEGQHHAPAALPPGKTRYPFYDDVIYWTTLQLNEGFHGKCPIILPDFKNSMEFFRQIFSIKVRNIKVNGNVSNGNHANIRRRTYNWLRIFVTFLESLLEFSNPCQLFSLLFQSAIYNQPAD